MSESIGPNSFLSSSYARILFRHLRLTEQSGGAFFEGTDVTYRQLMELDGHLAFDVQSRLFENALRISDRPDLGLSVGTQLHLSVHGPVGIAAFSSPNLGCALDIFVRYSDVRAQFVEIRSDRGSGVYRLQMVESLDLGRLRCFLTESVMSAVYSAIQFFVGASPISCELRFAYPEPEYGPQYRRFFRYPVAFGQAVTEVVIADEALGTPSPVADESMHKNALEQCEKLLRSLKGPGMGYEDLVRNLISQNPGRLWTIDEIAKKLHVAPRTLMRKLKSEGARYQTIRDDILKQQATHYLADPNLTVESVGHLLGFSDVASFRRSFKRWFGETPSAYSGRMQAH
jgi:AraC-like DNA-binding protein